MLVKTAAAVRNPGGRTLALSAMSVVVILVGAASGAAAPLHKAARGCANASANPSQISPRAAVKATLCLLNHRRRAHHVGRLHENSRLELAALRHSRDMAHHNYFEHGDFIGRIRHTSYLSGVSTWAVGENIAWGSGSYATPGSIVKQWMHSPPHRQNILGRRFREIGIGIAQGTPESGYPDGATYTTDFGARG